MMEELLHRLWQGYLNMCMCKLNQTQVRGDNSKSLKYISSRQGVGLRLTHGDTHNPVHTHLSIKKCEAPVSD